MIQDFEVNSKLIGSIGELGVADDNTRLAIGGNVIPIMDDILEATAGFEMISDFFHYDYDGTTSSFVFPNAPTKFIRIYATDGRTNLYELVPGDYTIDGNTVTVNSDYLPAVGWYIEGMYTYKPAGSGTVDPPAAEVLAERISALETAVAAMNIKVGAMETAMAAINDAIAKNTNDIAAHISADANLYQSLYAKFMSDAQELFDDEAPKYDMNNGEVVESAAASLVAVDVGKTYTVPSDGLLSMVYKATILGVSPTVTKNGEVIFSDGIGILGLGTGNPVTERVAAGDTIVISGSLGLLTSFNVTFYPQI